MRKLSNWFTEFLEAFDFKNKTEVHNNYPKSNTLPKPTTPQESQAKMYQTGHEDQSLFAKIMNWFNGLFK